MAEKEKTATSLPRSRVNELQSMPRYGQTLYDIFNAIQGSFDTLARAIDNRAPTVTTQTLGPNTPPVASYMDDSVITPFDSTVARDLALRAGDTANILDWGADPTGVTDSAPAFRNAIAALQAGSGTLILRIPYGTYRWNTQVRITGTTPVIILADPGTQVTRHSSFALANPLLRVSTPGVIVSGLRFRSTLPAVSGTKGVLIDANNVRFENVNIVGFTEPLRVTDATGCFISGCVFISHDPGTVPLLILHNSSGCFLTRNSFVNIGNAVTYAITETGTSDSNLIPPDNRATATALFNPRNGSVSGAISNILAVVQYTNAPTDQATVTFERDSNTFKIVDNLAGVPTELVRFTPATGLTELANVSADNLDTNLALVGHMSALRSIGIAGGFNNAELNAISDSTALIRFRPADNAIDVSVEAASGTRIWKQLFPLVLPPSAPNVVSVTCVLEYQLNEDGGRERFRLSGVVTLPTGPLRVFMVWVALSYVGKFKSGTQPENDTQFTVFMPGEVIGDTYEYATEWLGLPDEDSEFLVRARAFDQFKTETPDPVDSATVEVEGIPAPQTPVSVIGTPVYLTPFVYGVRVQLTYAASRNHLLYHDIAIQFTDGTNTWEIAIATVDVAASPASLDLSFGDGSWLRPDPGTTDENATLLVYTKDRFGRTLGPNTDPFVIESFKFTQVQNFSLSMDVLQFPGNARFTGTADPPSQSLDPDFSGVRVYYYFGNPTGITFNDLNLWGEVDYVYTTPLEPIVFDFTLPQPGLTANLRVWASPKHKDTYDEVKFGGPTPTPFLDFVVPELPEAAQAPSVIRNIRDVSLTGTDPIYRVLNATADVPLDYNNFDGCLIYYRLGAGGGTGAFYSLGFAHHTGTPAGPFVVALEVILPDELETRSIYFEQHSRFGITPPNTEPIPYYVLDFPARPTLGSAPLADNLESITITVAYSYGQYRISGTVVFPTPRASIVRFSLRLDLSTGESIPLDTSIVTPSSGNYTFDDIWRDLDFNPVNATVLGFTTNVDGVDSTTLTASNTIALATNNPSGAGTLVSWISAVADPVPNADGIERNKYNLTWTNPTDEGISLVSFFVRTSVEGRSEERPLFEENLDVTGQYGVTISHSTDPYDVDSVTLVFLAYSYTRAGTERGPATISVVVVPGPGNLQLDRADLGSIDSTNFQVSGGRLRVAVNGIGNANLQDSAVTTAKVIDLAITSPKIANLSITTAKIDSLAVTTDKIAALAISSSQIQDLAITSAKIAALAVNTGNIQNAAITSGKIASLAINSTHIENFTITATKIASNTITAAQIASNTITSAQIATNTITGANIADASITASKIASFTITASQIASLTITAAQIADLTINGVKLTDGSITDPKVAVGTLSGDKLQNATIVGSKIASGTITGTNIASAAITGINIATATITGDKIGSATITGDKIANFTLSANNLAFGTITAAQIQNLTITASQIADLTITSGKIASITADKISAGTISVSITMTAPNIIVTGGNFQVQINNLVGIRVTGSFNGYQTDVDSTGITFRGSGLTATMNQVGFAASDGFGAAVICGINAFAGGGWLNISSSSGNLTLSTGRIFSSRFGAGVDFGGGGQYLYTTNYRVSPFTFFPPLVIGGFQFSRWFAIHDANGNYIGKSIILD